MSSTHPPSTSTDAELLGRRAACAEVVAAIDRAGDGRGSFLLIEGEAGIGKTTVASWATERAGHAGFGVRWGRCDADAATPPLGPWVQLAHAHERGLEPGAVARWRRAAARPAEHGTGADAAVDGAATARRDLLHRWCDAWTGAADHHPLVLVVDDIHWADVSSLLLLAELARRVAAHPLVVVATMRTGEPVVERLQPELERVRALATVVPLGGLPVDAIAELVHAADLPDDPALVEVLVERTGANPFFLSELLAVLSQSSAGGVRRIAATEVPRRVSDVVQRRVARLPTRVADLLAAAAVLGTEGDVARLAATAEVTIDEAMEQLDVAAGRGLVAEGARGRWRFAHALVRDAVHDGLPSRRRHGLHDRAVTIILAEPGVAAPADLARHALAALPLGDPDRAVAFAAAAAADALAQLAYEEAADLALAALDVLGGRAGDGLRLELLVTLGDARRAAGRVVDAQAAYREVADDADADPSLVARAALGFADPGADLGIAYQAGDPTTGDLLDTALAAVGDGDSPIRVSLLSRLAAELYFSSQADRSRPLAEQAVAMADRLGDPRAQLQAEAVFHDAFVVGDEPPGVALDGSTRLVALARAAGDRRSRLVAHRARVFDLLVAGDLDGVDAEASAFARLADELAGPGYSWWPAIWRAMRALLAGRHDEAETLAAAATALAGDAFTGLAASNFGFVLFFLRREQGRLAELEAVVRSFAAEQGDIPAIAPALALLLAELGRDDEAAGVLARLATGGFRRLRDRNWPVSWFQLARSAYLVGDLTAAERLAEAGAPLAGSCLMVSLGTACLGSADLGLAWLADVGDRPNEADFHYRQAESVNGRLGAGPWLAQARVDHAHLLWRRDGPGDRAEGTRLASLADAAADDLPPVRRRARQVLDGRGASAAVDAAADGGVFRRNGPTWELAYAGRRAVVPHAKGLADLRVLLDQPGHPMHVRELLALQSTGEVAATAGADDVFDRRARAEIKQRLDDLAAEADDADADHDLERAARARAEQDELVDALTRAVGLGGRSRRLDDPAERARKTVTARIRNAIKRVEPTLPELAVHLTNSVDTGLWCVYRPERPTPWAR